MSAPGKIVGVGGNFLMLHFNKPKITRAFRMPMPGPRLFIAPRMSDATLSHYFARLESEMMLFVYAKMLHETGKSSRYPVFSAGGAQVQRVKSTQVKDSLPDWMPVIDDKPAFALAHQAHCQLLVDAQPLQAMVPAEVQPLVEEQFSGVSLVTRMHNYVDSGTDKYLIPKFVHMNNALGATESPLTYAQVVAALQYMNRAQHTALLQVLKRIEEALVKKEGGEEEWTWRRDIAKQVLKLNQDAPLPEGLTPGVIADTRDAFHAATVSAAGAASDGGSIAPNASNASNASRGASRALL
jgi:hypothetical protein